MSRNSFPGESAIANFKFILNLNAIPIIERSRVEEELSGIAAIHHTTGILDWSVSIADSEKILGIADEFIDLSSRQQDAPNSIEVWFAHKSHGFEFQKVVNTRFPKVVFSALITEAEQDWMALWRQHYSIQKISFVENSINRTLYVVPAWQDVPNEAQNKHSLAMKIHPGQAFGAGTHATTRLCLRNLLSVLAAHKEYISMQDFGSGTGILGIAALLLARKEARKFTLRAYEIEEPARKLSEQNAKLNAVDFFVTDRPNNTENPSYHLTVANVLVPVLLSNRAYLWHSTKPGGTILLSGILQEEAKGFHDEFLHGFSERIESSNIEYDGDWSLVSYTLQS